VVALRFREYSGGMIIVGPLKQPMLALIPPDATTLGNKTLREKLCRPKKKGKK